MQTHLHRREGRYYYRRRIPTDLIEHYGRQEIQKALGTSDPREAKKLVRTLAAAHDDEFQALREARQLQARPAQTTQIAIQASIPQVPIVGDVHALAAKILERLRREREQAMVAGRIDQFLEQQRWQLDEARHELKGKGLGYAPAWQYEAALLARQQLLEPGKYMPIPTPSTLAITAYTQPKGGSHTDPVSLDKAVEYWKLHGGHSNVRTLAKVDKVIRRFKALVGDLPVQSVTKRHCAEFLDRLREEKTPNGKPLSVATINDSMDKLRAVFGVAVDRGVIEKNPASNLAIEDNRRAREKRQPFDVPALQRIFTSPVYTSGMRPVGGAGEAAFWLPLLALFTGARMEELGQIAPPDISQEAYEDDAGKVISVWVLWLHELGEGQELKNSGSMRRIPLHAELLHLGFVQFVQSRNDRQRVFHELRPDVAGRETGNYSKWFGRWLRVQCGVTDPRMVFHSFRHGFKDLCRQAGIDEQVHDALTGHVGENRVSRDYGSDHYPLRPLVEAMGRFRLPQEVQAVIGKIQ